MKKMKEKISEIKSRYQACSFEELPAFIESVKEDDRAVGEKALTALFLRFLRAQTFDVEL